MFISVGIITLTLHRYIFTDPALVILQRVRILKILATILTLESLGWSMDILHVSVQTVLVKCLVTIGALNPALLLPAACESY